jgi:hypothetical protein
MNREPFRHKNDGTGLMLLPLARSLKLKTEAPEAPEAPDHEALVTRRALTNLRTLATRRTRNTLRTPAAQELLPRTPNCWPAEEIVVVTALSHGKRRSAFSVLSFRSGRRRSRSVVVSQVPSGKLGPLQIEARGDGPTDLSTPAWSCLDGLWELLQQVGQWGVGALSTRVLGAGICIAETSVSGHR